jgi:hypothetical protein
MKKKEIIFFLTEAINKRNLERLGYLRLKKNFDIKFIDLTILLNKKKLFIKKNNFKNITKKKIFLKVKSWDSLKKEIKKKVFFIDFTTQNSLKFILLQKYLVKKGSKKIHLTSSILPNNIFFSIKKKFYSFIKNLNLYGLIKQLLIFVRHRVLRKLSVDPHYALICGNTQRNFFSKETKIIESHSLDYDRYLKVNSKKKMINKKRYNVFIDQMMFAHPDGRDNKLMFDKKKEIIYLKELKNFFIYINKKYKKKIIFNFHPRSTAKHKMNIKKIINLKFCKFQEWEKTDISIKNSDLVMGHTSSAFQFAILWRKPIIFLTHSIFSDYNKKYIEGISSEIKSKPLNFDSNNLSLPSIKELNRVNRKIYDKYIYNYIAIDKSKKDTWEKLIKLINNVSL